VGGISTAIELASYGIKEIPTHTDNQISEKENLLATKSRDLSLSTIFNRTYVYF
jgi:ADP-ribosylglycohydrolase